MLISTLVVTERLPLLEIVDDHFYQESQKEDLHQGLLQKIFLVGIGCLSPTSPSDYTAVSLKLS